VTQPLFSLRHFVTEANVAAVIRYDLYAYYSKPRHHHAERFVREQQLITAWLSPDKGARQ
jgi:hypothetical protein